MPFCKNCGQPLADNAKFCGSCGTPVQPAAEPAQTPAYQAAPAVPAAPAQPAQPVQPAQPAPEQPVYSAPSEPSYQPQPGYQPQQNFGGGSYIPPEQPPKKKSKTGLIIGIAAAAVVVITAIVLVLVLGGKGADFTGYWECVLIDDGSGEPFDEYFGIDADELFAFVLNDDHTFTMVMFGEDSATGKWSSGKDSVTMTVDGDSVVLSYEKGQLVMDLSDDGDTVILYFEREGSKAPRGFGGDSNEPVSEPTEEPVKPSSEPSEEPSDAPVAAGELGPEASYYFDDFSIEILGGQPCTDDYTDYDCFRVFFRFTNNSDEPTSALYETYLYAFQGQDQLDTDWISDDTDEDNYYSLNVMPGTSIICSEVFALKDNSPLELYVCEDWEVNKTECAKAVFDVDVNTAAGIKNTFAAVSDPTWTDNMTDEITWDDLYVFIDSAETANSWLGEKDLIRVYFNWTNLTDEATSFWMETTVTVYQDDVELFSGTPDESLVSDDMYSSNIEPGASKTVSKCFELRSKSPVVVLVYNWAAGEYIGCTFTFNS